MTAKQKKVLNFFRLAKIVTGAASFAVDPSGTTATAISATGYAADTKISLSEILASRTKSADADQLTKKIAKVLQQRLDEDSFHLPPESSEKEHLKGQLIAMLERSNPDPSELVALDLGSHPANEKADRLVKLLLSRLHSRYQTYLLQTAFRQWLQPVYEGLFNDGQFLDTYSIEISRQTIERIDEVSQSLKGVQDKFGSYENVMEEIRIGREADQALTVFELENLILRLGLPLPNESTRGVLFETLKSFSDKIRKARGNPLIGPDLKKLLEDTQPEPTTVSASLANIAPGLHQASVAAETARATGDLRGAIKILEQERAKNSDLREQAIALVQADLDALLQMSDFKVQDRDFSGAMVTYLAAKDLVPRNDAARIKKIERGYAYALGKRVATCGTFEQALSVLRENQHQEIVNSLHWNTLLNMAPNFEAAEDAFDSMIESGVEPDKFTYAILMKYAPNYWIGRQILEEMIDEKILPDEVLFNTLLLLAPEFETGNDIINEMIAAGINPGLYTYNTVISMAPNFLIAKQILVDMQNSEVEPDTVTFNTVLNLSESYMNARSIFNEMRTTKVRQNTRTFNTLLKFSPDLEGSQKILREMKERGVKPDAITYNTLLNTAIDLEDGREIVREMSKAGLEPDVFTYNTLLKLAPKIEVGRKIVNEMRELELTPDVISYNTLSKLEDFNTSVNIETVREMLSFGVMPTVVTYAELLKITHDLEACREILDSMLSNELAPSVVHFSIVASILPGNKESIAKLLELIASCGVQPNASMMAPLISRAEDFESAYEILQGMHEYELSLLPQHFGAVLRRAANCAEVQSVLALAEMHGVFPTHDLLSSSLRCSPTVGIALQIIELFGEYDVHPIPSSFNQVMKKADELKDVLEVFAASKAYGVSSNLNIWHNAMKSGLSYREAISFLEKMTSEGFAPNSSTYLALMKTTDSDSEISEILEMVKKSEIEITSSMSSYLTSIGISDFDPL